MLTSSPSRFNTQPILPENEIVARLIGSNSELMNSIFEAEAEVVEIDTVGRVPRARVWVKGIHDPDLLKKPNELPWALIELGSGTSKTGGVAETLYKGQKVTVKILSADCTKFKIVAKVSKHEPKPKSASKGSTGDVKNPNSVKSGSQNGKIVSEDPTLKNEKLTEISLPKLATCYINNLIGTIFTKFNHNLIKCKCNGAGTLNIISSCNLPVITCNGVVSDCSTPGVCDLSKDMTRMCEPSCQGSSIGNIGALVKVDGYSCDMNNWKFQSSDGCSSSDKLKIAPDGTINVQPNCPPGTYTAKFDMGMNSLSEEEYQRLIDENPDFIIPLTSAFTNIDVIFKVVEDLQKLDFTNYINVIEKMAYSEIGPIFREFEHLPTFLFEMDRKTTDLATFGQLYVNIGPSDLTPSLEMDFTVGKLKTKNTGLKKA